MIIAIDFDETIVKQDKPYDQVDGEFNFIDGAEEGLWALKRAGHTLLLWSNRASHALRMDWRKNPIWAADPTTWSEAIKRVAQSYALNEQRYQEMLKFVEAKLTGLFDAIDDGSGSKPIVDIFVDDKAVQLGGPGITWPELQDIYGEPDDNIPSPN